MSRESRWITQPNYTQITRFFVYSLFKVPRSKNFFKYNIKMYKFTFLTSNLMGKGNFGTKILYTFLLWSSQFAVCVKYIILQAFFFFFLLFVSNYLFWTFISLQIYKSRGTNKGSQTPFWLILVRNLEK